jgi:hypothetical protein
MTIHIGPRMATSAYAPMQTAKHTTQQSANSTAHILRNH